MSISRFARSVSRRFRLILSVAAMITIVICACAGCGKKGERLLAIASFKQPTIKANGPIFVRMMLAYYQVGEHESADVSIARLSSIEERLAATSVSENEQEALRSLMDIQAVDQAEERPAEAQLQSMTPVDMWSRLSTRSRLAFAHEFP